MNPVSSPNPLLSPSFLWFLFVFVLGLWTLATIVLEYHWKAYGIPESKIAVMKYVYFVGSSFFLVILFLAALTFSLS